MKRHRRVLKYRLAPESMSIGYRRPDSRRDANDREAQGLGRLGKICSIEGGYRLHRRTAFQISRHFRDHISSNRCSVTQEAGEVDKEAQRETDPGERIGCRMNSRACCGHAGVGNRGPSSSNSVARFAALFWSGHASPFCRESLG
jgi:hypothetical protein